MTTDDTGSFRNGKSKTKLSKPLTREALYKLVWSEPMLKVAAMCGVSSSYMARVCTLLNVPRPPRGYWAKLFVGKALPIPPLPDARPGDELVWARDGQQVQTKRPLPSPPSKITRRRSKTSIPRPDQHPLLNGAKELFEAGRLSREVGYLKPNKRLLVDLIVSKTGLDKALSFANELFLDLDNKGYEVVIAPNGVNFRRAEVDEHEVPRKNLGYGGENLWSQYRSTVVYVGTVAIGLTIIEMSEVIKVRYVKGKYIPEKDYVPPKRPGADGYTWTTDQDFATGRLCLQAYSPYRMANWVKRWQETKDRDLNRQIKVIVKELEKASEIIARLVEEGERQAEIEHQKWEVQRQQWLKEEAELKAAKALKESREELLQIIKAWGEATRIDNFFQDAEKRASSLSDDQKVKMLERLRLAREMIGSVDALDYFLACRSPAER
jgi:hypothetical protein